MNRASALANPIAVNLSGYFRIDFKKSAEVKLVVKPQFICDHFNWLRGKI